MTMDSALVVVALVAGELYAGIVLLLFAVNLAEWLEYRRWAEARAARAARAALRCWRWPVDAVRYGVRTMKQLIEDGKEPEK